MTQLYKTNKQKTTMHMYVCLEEGVYALIDRQKIDRMMIQVWGNYGKMYSLQHSYIRATWGKRGKGIRQEIRKEI